MLVRRCGRDSGVAASAASTVEATYQVISDGTGAARRGRVTVVAVSSVSGSQHRMGAAKVYRGSVAPHCGLSCEQTGGQSGGAGGQHVPAQVSELLVDALESHGGMCMCVGVERVVRAAVFVKSESVGGCLKKRSGLQES